MEKVITILIFVFLISSCKTDNKQIEINKETELYGIEIYSESVNRGIVSFNDTYYLFSNSALVFNDTFPSWIKDRDKADFSFKKYKFEPTITDIDVPFRLLKYKNEDFFYVIKNSDTLKFRIGEF
ncbi:MAG: hypothetical protein MUF68_09425 [Cyclobacteriaceae bacterium]|jgi:hypothetical protein|nr:hypothetical protein [Cyclobacteriaceae bacterium]